MQRDATMSPMHGCDYEETLPVVKSNWAYQCSQ
ncbi:hypothetical protein J2S73_002607 [Amorphus orientalis]|uniref:Uncharacterized protein n=1 Tax=Amorphus orientalis TaxID=649198 RepID=A0AAE3VQT7_9HYPH|nr:hypothetical protein [Amorphus orientalis]